MAKSGADGFYVADGISVHAGRPPVAPFSLVLSTGVFKLQ